MNPKEKLYFLLVEYLKGNYSTKDFADWFTNIFNLEMDYSLLSKDEYKYFKELEEMTGRFSPYEEDLKLPNVFFNEQEILEKAKYVYDKLFKNLNLE
jgi:hypothetical protein